MSRKQILAMGRSSRVAAFELLKPEMDAKASQGHFVALEQQESAYSDRSLVYRLGSAQALFGTAHLQPVGRKPGFAEYRHCRIASASGYELTAPAGKGAIH